MSGDEPTTEELRLRQLEEERAQLRGLEHAQSEADAETHLRRADKAGYLRQKLEEQQRADREADPEAARLAAPALLEQEVLLW